MFLILNPFVLTTPLPTHRCPYFSAPLYIKVPRRLVYTGCFCFLSSVIFLFLFYIGV